MSKEIIGVLGGGPAGIMAAGEAAGKGNKVILFEKNEKLGKKLFITGKGRCNITNAGSIDTFFDNIMSNKEFMYSSLYTWTNDNIIDLLEGYGVKTKVERGDRVFPKSNKSSDVIKAFTRYLKDREVQVKLGVKVKSIERIEGGFLLRTSDGNYVCNKLIIATGGKSYPMTGSSGDGFKFAEKLGHTITELRPALVPIEIKEDYIKDLQGLSLRNVSLSAYSGKKKIYEDFGEMIITHYGISGPIVLSMSSYLYDYVEKGIKFYIDLKPALDYEKLNDRILRDFEKYSNKHIKNALGDLLPAKLIEPVIKLSKIDLNKPINQITKEERNKLISILKKFPMTFRKFRPIEEAIVTSGGVSTDEIDPSTMESKIVPGLFFAGEVIDVDALTGGYNLQIAYSTGYLAGNNI